MISVAPIQVLTAGDEESAPFADSAILFLYGADHSRRAINFHERTVFPQRSCVLYSCNARQPILSRDKCPMLEESADLEDNASCIHEERRPARIRRSRHEYLSFFERLLIR